MESRLLRSAGRSPWISYGVGVAAPVASLLIRLLFLSVLGDKAPYVTFFLSTAVSASFGGLGPGLVSTLIGGLLGIVFVVPPFGSATLNDAGDVAALTMFLAVGSFISYLCGRLIRATRHENALRVLFQQTLVSIGDAVISTDEKKRVRLMNPVAEKLTGWSEAEAKGRPLAEVFRIVQENSDTPADIPVDQIIQTGKSIGIAHHTELITRAGERIPIDDSGAPIRGQDDKVVGAVLVFRDITVRRQTELELKAAEERSRNILNSITEPFLLLSGEWRYTEINPAAEKLMRTPAASLIGRIYWEEHPDTLGTNLERLFRKSMHEGTPVRFENFYAPWDQWFDVSAYRSKQGLAVYFRDITERKRSEAMLLRLNEDLKQFTFAATHDIREPLRMISVYVEMLKRKLGNQLDEQAQTYITHVVNGVRRISRLLDGLLQFSRMGETDPVERACVDGEAALTEALDDLQIAIREAHADITHDPLPQVMGEPAPLSQLFQNLVGNALKYRKPDIPPVIHVSARPEVAQWIFSVRDNGIGIPPEHQGHIFIPFTRLHGPEIEGAGIGLATCKRVVERYGGRIWVESKKGEGSTFYFSLPAAGTDSQKSY